MINLLDEYSISELETLEIKYLDLNRQIFNFSRGAKTTRDYLYSNDSLAIQIRYDYTYKNSGRDIASVLRHVDFYDNEGNIFLTKDITKPMNITQLGDLNGDVRKGRIHYMKETAKGLPSFSPHVPEPWKSDFLKAPDAMEVLTNYYRYEIKDYIEDNSQAFEERIMSETNSFMLGVLNLNVRPPDGLFQNGLTIKQTICHQLTGEY